VENQRSGVLNALGECSTNNDVEKLRCDILETVQQRGLSSNPDSVNPDFKNGHSEGYSSDESSATSTSIRKYNVVAEAYLKADFNDTGYSSDDSDSTASIVMEHSNLAVFARAYLEADLNDPGYSSDDSDSTISVVSKHNSIGEGYQQAALDDAADEHNSIGEGYQQAGLDDAADEDNYSSNDTATSKHSDVDQSYRNLALSDPIIKGTNMYQGSRAPCGRKLKSDAEPPICSNGPNCPDCRTGAVTEPDEASDNSVTTASIADEIKETQNSWYHSGLAIVNGINPPRPKSNYSVFGESTDEDEDDDVTHVAREDIINAQKTPGEEDTLERHLGMVSQGSPPLHSPPPYADSGTAPAKGIRKWFSCFSTCIPRNNQVKPVVIAQP